MLNSAPINTKVINGEVEAEVSDSCLPHTLLNPVGEDLTAVATDGAGTWLVAGAQGTDTRTQIQISSDNGHTWASANEAAHENQTIADVLAYAPTGEWLLHAGQYTGLSPNGTSWTETTSAGAKVRSAFGFASGVWHAGYDVQGSIVQLAEGADTWFVHATIPGGPFVAVNELFRTKTGRILALGNANGGSDDDGATYEGFGSGFAGISYMVEGAAADLTSGRVVAVGWDATNTRRLVGYSDDDGENFSLATLPAEGDTNYRFTGVTYIPGQASWYAVGEGGRLICSTDGITWALGESGTAVDFHRIAADANSAFVVGDNGTILVINQAAVSGERPPWRRRRRSCG